MTGFYFNLSNECVSNPVENQEGYIEDCEDYQYNLTNLECLACKYSYYYNQETNKCVSYLDSSDLYHVVQCVKYEIVGDDDNNKKVRCMECLQGYFVKNIGDSLLSICEQNPSEG